MPIRYLGFFLPEISIQPGSLTGCHYRGTTIGGPNVTLTVGATQAIELSSNLLRTAQVRRCSQRSGGRRSIPIAQLAASRMTAARVTPGALSLRNARGPTPTRHAIALGAAIRPMIFDCYVSIAGQRQKTSTLRTLGVMSS